MQLNRIFGAYSRAIVLEAICSVVEFGTHDGMDDSYVDSRFRSIVESESGSRASAASAFESSSEQ
jgi:hypothetical protein